MTPIAISRIKATLKNKWHLVLIMLLLLNTSCTSQRDFVKPTYVITKETPIYAIGYRYDFIAIKLSNGNYYNGFQPEVAMLLRSRSCNKCLTYATNMQTSQNQYSRETTWNEHKISLTDNEYALLEKAYNSPMKEEVDYLQEFIDAYNNRNRADFR